jgi:uncharacterized protein
MKSAAPALATAKPRLKAVNQQSVGGKRVLLGHAALSDTHQSQFTFEWRCIKVRRPLGRFHTGNRLGAIVLCDPPGFRSPAAPVAWSEMGMRSALIVYGGWEGHDPEECAAIYRRWLHEDGFSVRLETSTSAFADPSIHDLSLIVPIYTMSSIEKDEVTNLVKAVEGGVGLAGHHGGMADAFRNAVEYQFMVGGQWVAHPGNIIDYTVDVTRPDDPIMDGIPASFPYRSEQYYMHVDPSNEVLATTRFTGEHAPWIDGVVMPVVWKRRHGRGRVFYSSLGHQAKEFDTVEMATILRRGINWAARDEI